MKNKVEREYKQKLTNKLLLLTQSIECGDNSSSSFDEFHTLQNELTSIETKEHYDNNAIFKRNRRLCNDGNPKILKNWKDHKNSVNNISHLKTHDDHVIECPVQILNSFRTYFEDIYQKKTPSSCAPLIYKFCEKHSIDKDIEIGGYITEDEVQKAIKKLNKRSAPGADGLTPNFYRLFYLELSPILCKVYNSAFDYNSLPPSLTLSIIKLLPKKENSEQLKDFRPINLLNTDVKILSHILTSRVKTVLDKIINPFQFAYLPNRSIHSALHSIRKRINLLNRSRCVVNIDFSNAYDKIDREYLYDLLKGLNLDEITLKGIQICTKRTPL